MRRSLNLIDSHKKNESSFCHDRLGTSARKTEEDTPLFFEFPYVCPEPVLVK